MAENLKYIAWAKNLKGDIVFLRKYLSDRELLTPALDKLSNDALTLLSIEGKKGEYETTYKYAQRLSRIPWADIFNVIHTLSQPTKL